MNEHDHELERRLASLRPVDPSEGLLGRIAERISDPVEIAANQPRLDRRSRGPGAILVGLAAVVLLCIALCIAPSSDVEVPSDDVAKRDVDPVPGSVGGRAEINDTLPTVGNYRNAMRESPEALDALLEQHARSLMTRTHPLSLGELLQETSS